MAEKHVEPTVDFSLPVGDSAESASALDEAFASLGGDDELSAQGDASAEQKPAEQPPVAEGDPQNTGSEDKEGTSEEKQIEQTAAETGPAENEPTSRTPTVTQEEEQDPALKALDAVKLRSDASQKTKDTFANLKEISSARIKEKNEEIARIKAEQQAAIEAAKQAAIEEAKKQAVLPEDLQKEIDELRQLRARVDVESDPKFKEQFDSKKDSNYEAIYKELALYGLKESELKVLRKIGESEKIENITEMAEKLPPASRMRIEAKLFDNLNLSDARDKALKDARDRAQQIWQEREGQTKAQLETAKAEREKAVSSFKSHEIFKKSEIPANTPPEQRKKLEASNQHREKLQKLYDEVVNDDTPMAKAEAAFGLVLAHQFKSELDVTKSELAAAKKELEGIKKRSGVSDKGRLVNIAADGSRPKTPSFDDDAGSSLDDLARELGIR
ncbi:MAG: hypothetical protein EBR82_21560 [Caulobacteraceae bacterium]|nr:hypothetical protein [Caulobacteraceae bacterium]